MSRSALLGFLLLGCGGGCGESGTIQAVERPAQAAAVAPAPEPERAAESRYELRVEAPDVAVAGHEVIAKIHIKPKAPWHMNTEFPVALHVKAPSDVDVELSDQDAGDAQCFDDDCLVFLIPFTPKAQGAKELKTQVKFAVCGDSACAPDTVDVDLQVEVNCDGDSLC